MIDILILLILSSSERHLASDYKKKNINLPCFARPYSVRTKSQVKRTKFQQKINFIPDKKIKNSKS